MPQKDLYAVKTVKKDKAPVKLFPGQTDDYTLSWLRSRLMEMDAARPDQDWDTRYAQYEAETTWNEDGTANINLPLERSIIRLAMADEGAQKPIITFKPTEKNDIHKVDLTKIVWDFVWNEADTDSELNRARLFKKIFGTVWWKEYIKEEISDRYEMVEPGEDGKTMANKVVQKLSIIKGKPIDVRNFWIDAVHNYDDAVDCFELERDVSEETLESLRHNPNYKNIDEALKVATPTYPTLLTTAGVDTVFKLKEENSYRFIMTKKYDFFNYYNKKKGVYIVTVNNQVIIRESVNPTPTGGLPYVPWVDESKYMTIYGRGVPEQVESQKYECNVFVNQFIDLLRESSTNTLLLGNGVTMDDAELRSGVGRIINVSGDMNQVKWSTPPMSDKGTTAAYDRLMEQAMWISGVDVRAIVGESAKTLGQEQIREVNKMKALVNIIKNFDYFMVRMGRLRLAYIQSYLPYTTGMKLIGGTKFRTIPIEGKRSKDIMGPSGNPKNPTETEVKGMGFDEAPGDYEFLELSPDKIRSNLDITVETPSASSAMKQIEKLMLDEAFQAAMPAFQVMDPQKVSAFVMEYLKKRFEIMGLDLEKIFDEGNEDKQIKQVRQDILGDLPMPPRPMQVGANAEQLIKQLQYAQQNAQTAAPSAPAQMGPGGGPQPANQGGLPTPGGGQALPQ